MPKGSRKKPSRSFQINTGETSTDVIPAQKPASKDEKASVTLRYYVKSHECFSSWPSSDLKKFSAFVDKMNARTKSQITSDTDFCHSHKGKQKQLPNTVSPDMKVYSLDVTGAGRAHGFFTDGKFFLVWLDRKGSILGH